VTFEAENYNQNISRGGYSWSLENTIPGSSDGIYLEAKPNNDANIDTGYVSTSPETQYKINFNQTGTYFVWLLQSGLPGANSAQSARQ